MGVVPSRFFFLQEFNLMSSTNSSTFDTSSTPIPAHGRSWIFMFLFLSTRRILRIHPCSFSVFIVFIVFHFDIFTGRFNWFNVITNFGFISVQCFRRTHDGTCSATIVSRLLRIVHNIGFCGLHFFAQKEYEDVLRDVDWNELFSSVPIHQSLEVHRHFMANFAVHWDHASTVGIPSRNYCRPFARDFSSTAQHFCVHQCVFRSEIDTNRFHRNLDTARAPPSGIL